MISWMQKHRKYLVITIWISTIAFVGAGFVGWGAYSFSSNSSTLAKVGDIKITQKDFQVKYTNIYNYYDQIFNHTLTKQKAKELKLEEIAINQLITEAYFLNYAKEFGIDASNKEILKKIASIEAFWLNGKFNENLYNRILEQYGISSADFKEIIKKEIILDKLFKALSIPVTNLEERTLFSAIFLQDKLKYKIISKNDIDLKITEDDIKNFWQKNKQNYKSEQKYKLQLVKVDLKDIDITKQEIEEFYKRHKYNFKDLSGKIKPLEKAYSEVEKAAKYKKAKKEILKKYIKFKNKKIQAEQTIQVAKLNSIIPLDAMQQIISSKKGEYIKAIKTKNGYISVYIQDIIKPAPLPFEKAKHLAKIDLEKELTYKLLEKKAKEALKDLKDAKETPFFTKNDPNKLNFLNPQEAKEFIEYLFSLKKQDSYYVFANKAIAFKIINQKLFDKDLFEKNKKQISPSAKNLKNQITKEALLKYLEQKYEVEKYYSPKG